MTYEVACADDGKGNNFATADLPGRSAVSLRGSTAWGAPVDQLEPVPGAGALAFYSLPVGIRDGSLVANCKIGNVIAYTSVSFVVP
jgi:hypothetical protein